MESKTHTSQKEPAEGSREVIDRELDRQGKGEAGSGAGEGSGNGSGAGNKVMEDAAPQTEGRPGP